MLKRLICAPFQTGAALYIIVNALLTFNPRSAVLISLWQIIGGYSLAAVCYQIFAGAGILVGMFLRRANIEAMGLIMTGSTLAIRSYALLVDGDISFSDVNTTSLAVLFSAAALVRIYTLFYNTCSPKE